MEGPLLRAVVWGLPCSGVGWCMDSRCWTEPPGVGGFARALARSWGSAGAGGSPHTVSPPREGGAPLGVPGWIALPRPLLPVLLRPPRLSASRSLPC